ncbi:hypothetical protein ACA30_09355 [Virgibacillus soli]|nr:hypothetical protein ACA30_09355 [Virgibacillus soli]
MYNNEERELLKQKIEHFSKQLDEVQGLLLVGSGATGYRDQYSDLDLLVVVNNSQKVLTVQNKLQTYLHTQYRILEEKVYQHEPDIFVTCFLFNNYLGLDLGIWSLNKLRATKPNWLVLFDRDPNKLEKKLVQSLKIHTHQNLEEMIEDSLTFIWQFFRSSAIAIKRQQYIQAIREIDFIRCHIIRFICQKHHIHDDFEKSIDHITDPHVQKLQRTYEVKLEQYSMQQLLRDVLSLYFSVINISESAIQLKQQEMLDEFIRDLFEGT